MPASVSSRHQYAGRGDENQTRTGRLLAGGRYDDVLRPFRYSVPRGDGLHVCGHPVEVGPVAVAAAR